MCKKADTRAQWSTQRALRANAARPGMACHFWDSRAVLSLRAVRLSELEAVAVDFRGGAASKCSTGVWPVIEYQIDGRDAQYRCFKQKAQEGPATPLRFGCPLGPNIYLAHYHSALARGICQDRSNSRNHNGSGSDKQSPPRKASNESNRRMGVPPVIEYQIDGRDARPTWNAAAVSGAAHRGLHQG